ncbi:hypothetical protein ACF0H5_018842 [Mactra antiquata]
MGISDMKWISLVVLILGFLNTCRTETIDNTRALTSDLIANYSRVIKPKRNQSEPVEVSIGLQLLSIFEFDEVQEKLSIMAVTYLIWKDELMTWDPKDYGGAEVVYFESHQVWTPMLVLINTVNNIKKLGYDDDWLLVRYFNNGSAYFYPGGVLSAKCDVDVTYFPWDKHKCRFQFSTWGSDPNIMKITSMSDELFLDYYSPNGAWDLISTEVTSRYKNSLFEMYITLSRKPRFVVVNVISPIVLMALISTIVFYIPVDSGERISYSMTMLLAIAVFLTLIGDNLPKTSNPMSIFSYYLLSMLILNIVILIINILSVKCYFIGDKQPVSSCWASWSRCIKCKRRNNRKRRYVASRDANTLHKTNTSDSKHHQVRSSSSTTYSYSTEIMISHVNGRQAVKDSNPNMKYQMTKADAARCRDKSAGGVDTDIDVEDDSVTWEDVSVAIDILALIVSILAILILTSVFFFIIWMGGTKNS